MPHSHTQRARLSIDVEPELRRKIKLAATERDLSVREFVVTILQRAIEAEAGKVSRSEAQGWSRLSASAFARDWASEADSVYDHLP